MAVDDEQANSDPLPYTQVDRSVKPKAALLAGLLGVTNQHALGSLVEWWDLSGDPRELERLVLAGQTEVLLSPEEAERRFRLAAGKSASAADLEALGLLESKGDKVRVRGMSRYFAPILGRLRFRELGRKGGKASAAKRLEATGSAQPHASAPASEYGSTPAQAEPEAAPKRTLDRTLNREPKREPNRTEAAVSGQRSAVTSSSKDSAPALRAREPKEVDPRHAPLKERLVAIYAEVLKAPYAFVGKKDAAHVAQLLAMAREPEEVAARWFIALTRSLDPFATPKVRTLGGLVARWNHFPTQAPEAR